MRSPIDVLLSWVRRSGRPGKDAEVEALTAQSEDALRRVDRLVRLARIDAEIDADSAKQRVMR